MDSVNLQTAVENFKKRLNYLYKNSLSPELEKKYLGIYENVCKAYAKDDKDFSLLAARVRSLGFVAPVTTYGSTGGVGARLVISKADRLYKKASLCSVVPENDNVNLLSFTKEIPEEALVANVLSENMYEVAEISVYSTGAYDKKWNINRPSLSIREILSQVPENLINEVTAFAVLDDSQDCLDNFNVVLGMFTFKVILYGGEVIENSVPVVLDDRH